MVTADLKHFQRTRQQPASDAVARRLEQSLAAPRPVPKAPAGGQKYVIQKADGSPADPDARYLVLRLDTDPFARQAAEAYANAVADSDPRLAEAVRSACAAKIKPGWKLPAAPRCQCGSKCHPVAMQDIGRWLLEWECDDCCDPVQGPAIAWPFVQAFAEGEDFARIGIDWDLA